MIIANKELLDKFETEKLTTRKQYDEVKAQVEQLIAEATEKGALEPDAVNEYTQKISLLSQQMAAYEDEYLNILPLRKKFLHRGLFLCPWHETEGRSPTVGGK